MVIDRRTRLLASVVIPALALAACGGDKDGTRTLPTPPSPAVTQASPQFSAGPGADLQISLGGRQLPGCNDPNDSECPAPLTMDLDGSASTGGVTIRYPTRYFAAQTGAAATGVLIEIVPNENYKFNEKATFQVYFADSVEAALAELSDPLTAEWSTATLSSGEIGVVKDRTQDPPINTTIGAFSLADGRTIVLKLVTTGKYGWNLYSRVYEGMLNSLAVSGAPEAAEASAATEQAQ